MRKSDEELEQKMAAWEAHLAETDPDGLSRMTAEITEIERTNPEVTDRQYVLEVALVGFVDTLRQREVLRHSTEKYRQLMSHILFECRQPYLLVAALCDILENHFDPNDVLEDMSRCGELTAQATAQRKLD